MGMAARGRGLAALLVVLVGSLCFAAVGSAASTYDPFTDAYSMDNVTTAMGAQAWWDAGYTGAGIDVAVIDSGVSPVQGLSTPNKILYGPDLSLESQSPTRRNLDSFGHGTFMAGLIAGRDPSAVAPYTSAPAAVYRGMAPDARIVSIKVASADGGADVTQVIAAIDWVVQHAHDPGLNIRILNLSYGTNATQPYYVDPLAFAVEQAWKAGIVVFAAAGNTGYQKGHGAPGLADPAYDPMIGAVGAYDSKGTAAFKDDTMGTYSASCSALPGAKRPDFVTPGSHLQGLRVVGSYVDLAHPEGILGDSYSRGSGTSEATAIASGAAALILQKYPNLTPDQLMKYIGDNGQKVPGSDDNAQGKGELDLSKLLTKNPPKDAPLRLDVKKQSDGSGSIDASRGTDHVAMGGTTLSGEMDIFGHPIDAVALAVAEAAGNSWSGGTWNGNSWSGNSWSGNSWSGNSWSGNSWSGNSWSGNSWSGNVWATSFWG